MIHIDLVNDNTKLRIIRTETAEACGIELPPSLTTGGVGLPGIAQLVDMMNQAMVLLGLQWPNKQAGNTVIPEGEDA